MIHVNEVEKDSEELMSFHAPGSISIVSYMKEVEKGGGDLISF